MESKNILQVLINLKQMVEVSQSRGCWKAEEMKDIGITYNNVSEIVNQLQEQTQQAETNEPIETIVEQGEDNNEEIKEEKANQPDAKEVDESVEIEVEEMEDVD